MTTEITETLKEEGAVIAVLTCKNYLVLLREPSKRSAGRPLFWKLPGGHVIKGESLLAAFIREVEEETGIMVSGLPDLTAKVHLLGEQPRSDHTRYFLGLELEPELIARHRQGIIDCWGSKGEHLESTCFSAESIRGMTNDLLPNHREFIQSSALVH
ncbi:MAG: NUDIX hydrolase [Patescibacteria group bacterium]|nr:NUDIX hydrolase [Patescibacteria group bacterium]